MVITILRFPLDCHSFDTGKGSNSSNSGPSIVACTKLSNVLDNNRFLVGVLILLTAESIVFLVASYDTAKLTFKTSPSGRDPGLNILYSRI